METIDQLGEKLYRLCQGERRSMGNFYEVEELLLGLHEDIRSAVVNYQVVKA